MKNGIYVLFSFLAFWGSVGCGNDEDPIRIRVINEGGLELRDIRIDLTNGSGVQEIARLPDDGERTLGFKSGDACSRYVTAMALVDEELAAGGLCTVPEPLAPGDYVLTLRISVFDGMGIPIFGLRAELAPE